jgi:hypothetical protein
MAQVCTSVMCRLAGRRVLEINGTCAGHLSGFSGVSIAVRWPEGIGWL